MSRRKVRSNRLERVKDRSGSAGDGGGKQLLQLALMIMVLAMLLAFWGNLSKGAASCYANLGPKKSVDPVSAPSNQAPGIPVAPAVQVLPKAN